MKWTISLILTLLAAMPPTPEGKIVLVSPLARQVIQRDDNNQGRVAIKGSVDLSATKIEAQAVLMPGAKGKNTDWEMVAEGEGIKNGTFEGAIAVTAGGWYTIKVRALKEKETVAESTVERVGVGEVIITAGQSNSANHGGAKLSPNDDRVSAWDGKAWRKADDPQPIATGKGGTPWPVLGDSLVQQLQVPVGFISVGSGGTSVEQWQPGGKLYPRLKDALTQMGKNGVRCVLWHQGESDAIAGTSADLYKQRIETLIKQSRTDAGFDLPWFIAGVSYIGPKHVGKQAAVREGQKKACDNKLTFEGPETDDMHGDLRLGDGVHFSEKGLKEHARRWAEVLLKKLFKGNKPNSIKD